MPTLNLISFFGIFGLCFIAWVFSENRRMRYFPWRVMFAGIALQLILGACVFVLPGTRDILKIFSQLLDVVFNAAYTGANFVFGSNLVPTPEKPATVNLDYIFAFRALPAVIFFSGLMALLYRMGVIQVVTNIFAKIFYVFMRLSGAEALSGAANIFVGIEAAIVVKPFLPKMTRSELCAILSCCFGTAASSTLAIYVSFLKPVFPNILGHLVSASIMAIPACFVLSKILVPETEVPLTMGGLPKEPKKSKLRSPTSEQQLLNDRDRAPIPDVPVTDEDEQIARLLRGETPITGDVVMASAPVEPAPLPPAPVPEDEPFEERMGYLDSAITGAIDGVKMSVSIAAVLILILGFVYLINQVFLGLANLPSPVGDVFKVVTLANILGALFLPFTFLTGVSLEWNELWQSSVIIGRRLLETAIPPYQALAQAGAIPVDQGGLSGRAVVIVSYALSGFAHLASVGIFVGGMIGLIPSRRKDISELGWKALFVGTLATLMIAAVAGVFYMPDNVNILGSPEPVPTVSPSPSPTASPQAAPSPTTSPVPSPVETASPSPAASPSPTATPSPAATSSPAATPSPVPAPSPVASPSPSPAASPAP